MTSTSPYLLDEVERYLHIRPTAVSIHKGTADFFQINRGDILRLGAHHYVVTGTAREKSFGLDEEPKHWVKYAYDVSTGKRKIIKLVFLEQFDIKYGDFVIRCYRSPAKEGRILESVKGNLQFMQGRSILEEDGQEIRVIDHIPGKTLRDTIEAFAGPHEEYFIKVFPGLLQFFLHSLYALDYLHRLGLRHGDVRTGHLILDEDACRLRWIDFDYEFIFYEAPFALDLLGVGNILSDLVGKCERTIHNLRLDRSLISAIDKLGPEDFSVIEPTRLMNWRKLYPYIPEELNSVLMHFATAAERYYESAGEIAEDLEIAMNSFRRLAFSR